MCAHNHIFCARIWNLPFLQVYILCASFVTYSTAVRTNYSSTVICLRTVFMCLRCFVPLLTPYGSLSQHNEPFLLLVMMKAFHESAEKEI